MPSAFRAAYRETYVSSSAVLHLQIRRGVLGFELEQLPPDMAAAVGLPPQQQQQQQGECTSDADVDDVLGDLQGLRSPGAQLTDKLRYKEAAERLRARLANVGAGKTKVSISGALVCICTVHIGGY